MSWAPRFPSMRISPTLSRHARWLALFLRLFLTRLVLSLGEVRISRGVAVNAARRLRVSVWQCALATGACVARCALRARRATDMCIVLRARSRVGDGECLAQDAFESFVSRARDESGMARRVALSGVTANRVRMEIDRQLSKSTSALPRAAGVFDINHRARQRRAFNRLSAC